MGALSGSAGDGVSSFCPRFEGKQTLSNALCLHPPHPTPPPFFFLLEIAASSIWLVQMPGAVSEQTNRNGPIAKMNLSAWCLFSPPLLPSPFA